MALGQAFQQTVRAPGIIDPTKGLRDTLVQNEQRGRQKQADYTKALENFAPIAEQQTIASTLANIDKTGGVQSGLETQEALSKKYLELQSEYEPEIEKAQKMKEQAAASGIITYDSQGNETTDKTNPEVIKLNELLTGITTEYDTKLKDLNIRASKGDYSILDRVSNPKALETRISTALMSQGIDPKISQEQARSQVEQYQDKPMSDKEKLIMSLQAQNIKDTQKANTDINLQKLGTKTVTKGLGSSGSTGHRDSVPKTNTDKLAAFLDKEEIAKGNWTGNDQQEAFKVLDNIANTKGYENIDIAHYMKEELRRGGITGEWTSGKQKIADPATLQNNVVNRIQKAVKTGALKTNGISKAIKGGGTKTSVSTPIYNPNQVAKQQEINEAAAMNRQSIIDKLQKGSRSTAEQNIEELLGKSTIPTPTTKVVKAVDTQVDTKPIAKVKPVVKKEETIKKEEEKEIVKEEDNSIKNEIEVKAEKLEDTIKPVVTNKPSTYKDSESYGEHGNKIRKFFHDIFNSPDNTKESDSASIRRNADKLNEALGKFIPNNRIVQETKIPFSSARKIEVIEEKKTLIDYMKELGLSNSQIKAMRQNSSINLSIRKRIKDALEAE